MADYLLDTNHASPVDALIAVTALRYDLTLLTTDADFQAVPGLRLENWIF